MTQRFRAQNGCGFEIGYITVDGTDLWTVVSSGYWQGIFRIDLKTDIIHYVDEIPMGKCLGEYQIAVCINNKIIIPPYFSEGGFLEYDLNEKKFIQTDVGKDVPRKFFTQFAFSNVVKYKNSLFFLANHSKSIIEYRINTNEYIIRRELENILPREIIDKKYKVDLHCCRLVNDTLFYIIQESNILVELNLNSFYGRYYEIPYIKKAESLHICGDKLYVIPLYEDPFVCVDMNSRKAEKITNLSPNENLMMWLGMASIHKKNVLIPSGVPMLYSISNFDKEWKKEESLSNEWLGENPKDISGIFCSCVTPPEPDGRCFVYSKCSNCLIEISEDKNIVHKLKILLTDWDFVRERIWRASEVITENEILSIYDFLDFVNNDKMSKEKEKKEKIKSCGASIYKLLSK